MSMGALNGDKVACPWHAASFSIKTGALNGAPSLNSLPSFKIISKNGKSFVEVPAVLPKSVQHPLAKRDLNDKRHFVVLGGGPGGLTCAETLRQSGFTGEITIISSD